MPESNLAHIHTTPDEITAELVKGFLESNGVKAIIKPNPGPHGAMLGKMGGLPIFNHWLVYVTQNQEKEARALLKNFKEKN